MRGMCRWGGGTPALLFQGGRPGGGGPLWAASEATARAAPLKQEGSKGCPLPTCPPHNLSLLFAPQGRQRAHKPMTRPARRSKDPSPVRGGREGRRPEGRRRSKRGGGTGDGRSPPPRSRRVGAGSVRLGVCGWLCGALCGWVCAAGSVGLCVRTQLGGRYDGRPPVFTLRPAGLLLAL